MTATVRVNTAQVWTGYTSRGLSRTEAARRVGVSPARFKRWQAPSGGTTRLTPDELSRLAEACNYPLHFFLVGDEEADWQTIGAIGDWLALTNP